MSDTSQGPGWWRASDGKWYPPGAPSHVPSSSAGSPVIDDGAGAAEERQSEPEAPKVLRLQDDEHVLFDAQPGGAWAMFAYYFYTLGLYGFWRRATHFVVTDQRVIRAKGRMIKTQKSVPLEMIQDASLSTAWGFGFVMLSSAGGVLSVQKLGPMTSVAAHEMIDKILAERKRSRQPIPPAQDNTAMSQLKQLGDLRDAGVISEQEFEAKKTELLGRL